MKNLNLCLFVFFLLFCYCSSSNTDKRDLIKNPASATSDYKTKMPEIFVSEDVFDFGEIVEGQSISHNFIIKNVGNDDLFINTAKASCGCTVPTFTKEPIPAGKNGSVYVTFNSVGKLGRQRKTVTLVTNAIPNTKVLTIIGTIVEAQENY